MPCVCVADEMQAGRLRGERLDFGDARGVSHFILRHGARPSEHAVEERFGAEAGEIAQFAMDGRGVGIVLAAQEAAREGLARGGAVVELGAEPGAGDDAAALLARDQETETGHGRRSIVGECDDDG